MSEIRLEGVTKRYGAFAAADSVDLAVSQGELVTILGPSGSGKTTLLSLIAGLAKPTAGRIHIGGRDVTDASAQQRNIGLVFQSYALFPHMTVLENVLFPLGVRKIGGVEADRLARDALKLVRLDGLEGRRPSQLSGGQQQRVAIARAMIKTPKVFLFDEPLSNLDAKLRNHMRIEIARLHQALKTTTVYVTHDQHEAMTLADRIVLLRDGRIEQVGSPREIFERPRSAFVAGFIGTPPMNLVEMRVRDAGGYFELAGREGTVRVDSRRFALEGRERVTLGVRPAHLQADTQDGRDGGFAGEVQLIEYLGNEVLVSFGQGESEIAALMPSALCPRLRDAVRFVADPAQVHLFDIDTGASLLRADNPLH